MSLFPARHAVSGNRHCAQFLSHVFRMRIKQLKGQYSAMLAAIRHRCRDTSRIVTILSMATPVAIHLYRDAPLGMAILAVIHHCYRDEILEMATIPSVDSHRPNLKIEGR